MIHLLYYACNILLLLTEMKLGDIQHIGHYFRINEQICTQVLDLD